MLIKRGKTSWKFLFVVLCLAATLSVITVHFFSLLDYSPWLISYSQKMIRGRGIDITNWQSYKNDKYGFEFKYPQNYFLADLSSVTSFSLIKKKDPGEVDYYFKVDLIEGDSEMTLEEFMADRVKIICATDGLAGEKYCDRIIEKKQFTNDNQVNGYELYLNETNVKRPEGSPRPEVSNKIVGPVFVLDISINNDLTHGLVIFQPMKDYNIVGIAGVDKQREMLLALLRKEVSTFMFLE